MPFPLFKIPREGRNIIYDCCLPVVDGGNTVTPDVDRHRRCTPHYLSSQTVNGNIALLQTCQQAYVEGMETLYSTKIFYFNGYHDQSKVQDDKRTLRIPHKLGLPGTFTFCHVVPYCDYFTLKYWLKSIGSRGRSYVRHLRLEFVGFTFSTNPES